MSACRTRHLVLFGRRLGTTFLVMTIVMLSSIVVASTVFTQVFPGHTGAGNGTGSSNTNSSGNNQKIITPNCNQLVGTGFPSTAPAAGTVLFSCSSYGAIKVQSAGVATPTISSAGPGGIPPSPYTTLSLNVHADPPLLPCIPSDRVIVSGTPVTFTQSDVGHSFDYCASFAVTLNTNFPSFQVTWSS